MSRTGFSSPPPALPFETGGKEWLGRGKIRAVRNGIGVNTSGHCFHKLTSPLSLRPSTQKLELYCSRTQARPFGSREALAVSPGRMRPDDDTPRVTKCFNWVRERCKSSLFLLTCGLQ